MENKQLITPGSGKWSLFGAMTAAIAASACCAGPLILMLLGVSGAWIGNLSSLTPYQPIFVTAALGLLGLAFYKNYRKPEAEECVPGSLCASPKARQFNTIMLWIFAAIIVGLLAFPLMAPYAFAGESANGSKVKQVTLDVKNMTCATCAIPVRRSLEKVEGVLSAKVTMDPPQAVVIYDPSKATTDDLTKATTNAGYPSKAQKEGK